MPSASPRKQHTADVESQKGHIRRNSYEANTRRDPLIQTSQRLDPDSKPESENSENEGGRNVSFETPNALGIDTFRSLKDSPPQIESSDSSRLQTQDSTQAGPSTTRPISRPTRRPRGTISYVEPNLRDKMRRPTNELVDAVVTDRFRRISSSQVEKSNPGDEEQDIYTWKAKTKTTSTTKGDSDVSLQSSAHNDPTPGTTASSQDLKFHSLSELPTTVITERKRRTLSANKDDLIRSQEPGIMSGNSAYTVIPARKAPDRRRRGAYEVDYITDASKIAQTGAKLGQTSEVKKQTGITRTPGSTDKVPVSTVRHARRHSSNTDSRDNRPGNDQLDDHQRHENQSELIGKLSGSPQSSGSIHKLDNGISQSSGREQNGEVSLNETVEHCNPEDGINTVTDGGQIKRSQRAAARRRSMLL